MAYYSSDQIYYFKTLNRNGNSTAFVDLLVTDRYNTVYLANFINKQSDINNVLRDIAAMKTAEVFPASYHKEYRQFTAIMTGKNAYDEYVSKINDLTQALVVSKKAKPDIKGRQEWEDEEERRLKEGHSPRQAPEELILAWDGDFKSQIFKVLWDRYNTPMLEEWKDYIVETCIERKYYTPLRVYNFGQKYDLEAGLLRISEKQLEEIITEGITSYELNFAIMEDGRTEDESRLKNCETLDDYLSHFAADLGQRIQENSQIRFDPEKQKHHPCFHELNLHANKQGITGLFPPQADVVMGMAHTLQDEDYGFVIGEMGSGKTPIGAIIPYVTEAVRNKEGETPRPYRALVFSPASVVDKWMREIKERIPNVYVQEITSWKDLIALEREPYRPNRIEYYVISSDVAKYSYPLEPVEDWRYSLQKTRSLLSKGKKARIRPTLNRTPDGNEYVSAEVTGYHCPQCGGPLVPKRGNPEHFFKARQSNRKWTYKRKVENLKCTNMVETAKLPKHMVKDPKAEKQECGYTLWRPALLKKDSLNRKVSPAWYINKRFRRGFFKYLIADEVHEYKSGDTDRANAFGQLINHTEKQILLTGTLLGGFASDIFYLLARLDPKRLKRESIQYDDLNLFIERYGVYEHLFRDDNHGFEVSNSSSAVRRKTLGKKEKPGVSPHVYSRYLISNAAFLELSDLGYALPEFKEEPIFVEMDPKHKTYYNVIQNSLGSRLFEGGMRYISTYMNRIYQYSDMPFNQTPIKAIDSSGVEKTLVNPYSFDVEEFTPTKYYALTNKIDEEVYERGRKVLVYCRFTGSNPVDTYLYDKLKSEGYNVGILRSSGSYDGIKMPKKADREKWLEDMMRKYDWDVLITNPRLVAVGLDLLSFPTIVYYQLDYSTYNYMQSSRRSWRIKQTKPVEVYTLVYSDTIQSEVLDHIAKKMDAALAVQGKFSEEGLRAMAESSDGINALAKKLVNEGVLSKVSSIEDRWKRINESYQELQSVRFTGYDHYEMNPLGMDEIRRIREGLTDSSADDVNTDSLNIEDLNDYLEHIEDMIIEDRNVEEYNKGLRKKDKVAEGQAALALF